MAGRSKKRGGGALRLVAVLVGAPLFAVGALAAHFLSSAERRALIVAGPAATRLTLPAILEADPRELRRYEDLARSILSAEPLDTTPLVAMGLVAARRGDIPQGEAFMHRTLRYQPRNRLAHMWLFARAIERNDAEEAAEAGIRLINLVPSRGAELAPLIIKYLSQAEGLAAIREVAMSPATRSAIARAALSARMTSDQFKTMFPESALARNAPDEAGPRALRAMLEREGHYEELLVRWADRFGSQSLAEARSLTDGDFAGSDSGAPFAWTLSAVENALARRTRVTNGPKLTGLEVEVAGFASGTLASQTMLLEPGKYRVSYSIRSETERRVDELDMGLAIVCQPSNRVVGRTRFPADSIDWTRAMIEFAVPASDCRAQQLRVEVFSRDTNDWQSAQLTGLEISALSDRK